MMLRERFSFSEWLGDVIADFMTILPLFRLRFVLNVFHFIFDETETDSHGY